MIFQSSIQSKLVFILVIHSRFYVFSKEKKEKGTNFFLLIFDHLHFIFIIQDSFEYFKSHLQSTNDKIESNKQILSQKYHLAKVITLFY